MLMVVSVIFELDTKGEDVTGAESSPDPSSSAPSPSAESSPLPSSESEVANVPVDWVEVRNEGDGDKVD